MRSKVPNVGTKEEREATKECKKEGRPSEESEKERKPTEEFK
jgi:hypothetical protein